MRATAVSGLVLALCGAAAAQEREAAWEEQLRELGYRLVKISSINVINGLNLSKEQALKLRELARQAEEDGLCVPAPQGALCAELEGVRRAFADLEKVLVKGEPVPDALRARVMRERKVEASVIARGLTAPRRGVRWGACGRCHASPKEVEAGGLGRFELAPAVKAEMAYAHSVGAQGGRPVQALRRRAADVDAILTAGQKGVLSGFSCCLIPPQDLSDPVRVGQAALPGWQIDLLRKVRTVPEPSWPAARTRVIELMLEGAEARKVHLPEAERAAIRKRLEETFEKARGLSEVDFELQKEELAAALGDPPAPAREQTGFERAFWMLMPGSPGAYDELLRRLEAQAQKPATSSGPAETPT